VIDDCDRQRTSQGSSADGPCVFRRAQARDRAKFFIDAGARDRGLRELDLKTRAQFEAAIHLYESTGWKRGPDPASVCDRAYRLRR
jgi:hypothetical protein